VLYGCCYGDVIDEIASGALLTTSQAATICEVTDQTIYRWIEDAGRRGEPLGIKQATWLLSTARLLAYVEQHQGGLHARVKAENVLKKLLADLVRGRRRFDRT
jgi:hypothetical protein